MVYQTQMYGLSNVKAWDMEEPPIFVWLIDSVPHWQIFEINLQISPVCIYLSQIIHIFAPQKETSRQGKQQ